MNAQEIMLAAPVIKEAEDNQLKLSNLTGSATAQIIVTTQHFTEESEVVLVTTLGNGEYSVSVAVKEVPSILEIPVPKDFFEQNLVPGAVARFNYTVKSPGVSPVISIALVLPVVE